MPKAFFRMVIDNRYPKGWPGGLVLGLRSLLPSNVLGSTTLASTSWGHSHPQAQAFEKTMRGL